MIEQGSIFEASASVTEDCPTRDSGEYFGNPDTVQIDRAEEDQGFVTLYFSFTGPDGGLLKRSYTFTKPVGYDYVNAWGEYSNTSCTKFVVRARFEPK